MPKVDKRLVRWARAIMRKYQIDPQTVDIEEMIDPKLTYQENKRHIIETLITLIPSAELRQEFREKYIEKTNIAEKRARKDMEEYAEKEVERVIKNLWKNTKPINHPYKNIIRDAIQLLLSSDDVNLLIVSGEAGVGKTTLVTNTLEELKRDYVYLNGVTAYELYKIVYQKTNALIVLDDITFDERMLRLLKALTDTRGERVVTWYSSALEREHITKQLTFTGKVIIITNEEDIYANEHLRALVSRGITIRVVLTTEQKMGLIKALLPEDVYKCFEEDILEIGEISQKYLYVAIDLRVAKKYASALKISRETARRLIIEEIKQTAKEIRYAEKPYNEFYELTGLSKSTWKRYRRIIRMFNKFIEGQTRGQSGVKVGSGIKRSIKTENAQNTCDPKP